MKNLRLFSGIFLLLAFSLSAGARECPPEGSKSDGHTLPSEEKQILNVKKNRMTYPDDSQMDNTVTVRKMLNSEDYEKAFDEGKAVTITGYIYKAMYEGGESCNCYAKDGAHHDIHLLIKSSRSADSKGDCIVAEITPWTKTLYPDLTVGYLNSIKDHKVKITGWLMYDTEHTNVSVATNPDLDNPHRGTVWEVHPITEFEDLDAEYEDIEPTAARMTRNDNDGEASFTGSWQEPPQGGPMQPNDILSIILLGAILGLTGQGIRIAVGLKKLNDISENKAQFEKEFSWKKLSISLLYGCTIGIIGGVLMAVDSMDKVWDKSTIMAVIAAGYAGADFIEGFLTKNHPATAPTRRPPPTTVATGTPAPGGIPQH